jgi:hypothetical protein
MGTSNTCMKLVYVCQVMRVFQHRELTCYDLRVLPLAATNSRFPQSVAHDPSGHNEVTLFALSRHWVEEYRGKSKQGSTIPIFF